MSCKPFKSSKNNSKAFLLTKGAIDKFLNIIDVNKFRTNVNALTKQAKDKYNVDKGPLFTERTIMSKEKSYYQAVPNDEAFRDIDKASKQNVYYQIEEPKVNFDLKVVNKIESNISKINGWFKQMKDTDQFWKKVQSDLAIPKEQVELLRQSEGDTIEQKLVDFVSKYSYVVKVDTAKEQSGLRKDGSEFKANGVYYYSDPDRNVYKILYSVEEGGGSKTITKEEFENARQDSKPTQHYANLTVPGGTNYTENEISTPGITPSIKGHAQFSTDNGIGWFRSDDKTIGAKKKFRLSGKELEDRIKYLEKSLASDQGSYSDIVELAELKEGRTVEGENTKTRRILEVQSDLFQKGRDRTDLINKNQEQYEIDTEDSYYIKHKNKTYIAQRTAGYYAVEIFEGDGDYQYQIPYSQFPQEVKDEINRQSEEKKKLANKPSDRVKSPENQFLQLLNKDSNWVTFFIKSIVQDSAKKGYEKVLFPLGDTASKVEGHETVEEYIRVRKSEIEKTKEKIKGYDEIINAPLTEMEDLFGKPELEKAKKNKESALIYLTTFEEELKRAETEGFGALKPIYNFYENVVANILKKNYKVNQITDEYGNTWNEVELSDKDLSNILLQNKPKDTVSKKNTKLEQDLKEFAQINGIQIKFVDSLVEQFGGDYTAAYDAINRVVYVNENKAGIDTLGEEIAHSLVEALGDEHTLVKKALNLLSRTDYKSTLDPEYIKLYKNNEVALKKEVLGKMIAEVLVQKYEPKTEEEYKLFKAILQLIDKFVSMFKRNDRLEDTVKQLATKITDKETITFSDVKPDNAVYFQVDNKYQSRDDFPMQNKNFKLLSDRTKSVTIRSKKYEPGVYRFGNYFYQITLVNPNMSKASDIGNIAHLKRKFTDEEIKLQHIKDFFDDKRPAYIYQIQKLDDNLQMLYKENASKKPKMDNTVKAYYIFLKQQVTKDMKRLDKMDYEDPEFAELSDTITKRNKLLLDLEATGNKQVIIDIGTQLLDNLEIMLNNVEDPDINLELSGADIAAAEEVFTRLAKFGPTAQRAINLEQRLQPIVIANMTKEINSRANEGRFITAEEITAQTSDVSKLAGWFGKLSNSPNYIARTIHTMIKEVQTRVSTENKKTVDLIKDEVEKLREWSKANGISEKNMYDIFVQKHKGTTVLTMPYTPEFYEKLAQAKDMDKNARKLFKNKFATYDPILKAWKPKSSSYINADYVKIQKTPELKRFYNFHKKLIKQAAEKLPVKLSPEFIANIASNNLSDAFKTNETLKSKQLLQIASNLTGINIKEFQDGTFIRDEGLFQDLIPLKFIADMDADSKSSNLGDNLAKFVKFANNYEQMSEVLPTIRSMQNQLGRQSFTKSSDPTIAINGVESNIYQFIDTVIDMQVKGNMKKDEGKINIGTVYDEDGNPVGEKYVHASKVADFGMKYNSLLRIGLNPINAVTNVIIGDIGNIIEAFGNRFYSLTNLKDATNIYFKESFNKDSDLHKWRDIIGPLQELEDYETIEQVSTSKGVTKEKVEELMYAPQKIGENFLQNRTMIAILIKDGYMDSSGNTTEKGKNITEDETKRLINKVYEVNNKIHGRYSARDAAAVSQQVLPRMMMQFKKWIPAAIESRFESSKFNNDLGVQVEGRYVTAFRLLKKALKGDLAALQAGNLTETEIYNMRKNLAELTIALASMLSFIALGAFGDDDDELKSSAYYKFTMDQLDRVSGDLLFFVNPGSYTETALKPIALMKTTHDLINVVTAFPYIFGIEGSEYTSGSRKDENKFIAKTMDATPILAPIVKVARNFKDDVKYQTFNSQ